MEQSYTDIPLRITPAKPPTEFTPKTSPLVAISCKVGVLSGTGVSISPATIPVYPIPYISAFSIIKFSTLPKAPVGFIILWNKPVGYPVSLEMYKPEILYPSP